MEGRIGGMAIRRFREARDQGKEVFVRMWGMFSGGASKSIISLWKVWGWFNTCGDQVAVVTISISFSLHVR